MTQRNRKIVFSLGEENFKYLILEKRDKKFHFIHADNTQLDHLLVENFSLQEDFLGPILKKIQKEFPFRESHLLLPYRYFHFDQLNLKREKKKGNPEKILKKYLEENIIKIPWVKTHAYEKDFFIEKNHIKVIFSLLKQEQYRALRDFFQKYKFSLKTIYPDIFAIIPFLSKSLGEKFFYLFVDKQETYLFFIESGKIQSYKKFAFSYDLLLQEIMKEMNFSPNQAKSFLQEKAFSFSEEHKQLSRNIEKKMQPLIRYLLNLKNEKSYPLFVQWRDEKISLFSKRLAHIVPHPVVDDFSLFNETSVEHHFALHKKDFSRYEFLLARAMKLFQEKK